MSHRPVLDEVYSHSVRKELRNSPADPLFVTNTTDFGMYAYDACPTHGKTVKQPDGWRPPKGYERTVRAGWLRGIEVDMAYQCYSSLTGAEREFGSWRGAHSKGNTWLPSMPAHPSHLYGRAVNGALLKLKDSKVNLAVAFGERKDTAKFVTDTIMTGVDVIRALRKKDVRGIMKALSLQEKKKRPMRLPPHSSFKEVVDAPSKLVLTNSYALQPLLNDVYGVLEELNRRDNQSPYRYKLKGVSQKREDYRSDTFLWLSIQNARFGVVQTQRGFHSTKVRLDYYLDNPFLRTLSQLGITNPFSLAYELLPLSFVLDWFLPVGSYLDAIDAALGLTFRGGSVSHLTRMKTGAYATGDVSHFNFSKVKAVRCNIGRCNGRQVRLVRTALDVSPAPVYPSFKSNPWSAPHVSSALALLAQAVQGKSLRYR